MKFGERHLFQKSEGRGFVREDALEGRDLESNSRTPDPEEADPSTWPRMSLRVEEAASLLSACSSRMPGPSDAFIAPGFSSGQQFSWSKH